MHLERVGGRFVAAMAVLLAVACNAAFAQEHKTYRCTVADVVNWDDDGYLRLDSNPKDWMHQRYDGITIDPLTGAVTHSDGRREMWSVLKWGDGRENDYVLTNVDQDAPLARAMRGAVNQFIRIRTGGQKPIPRFLASWLDSFASGPCEVVR